MKTREDSYFEAVLSKDYRFDGKFYVAVKTTGIYCRPICPASPKRENVEFFDSALAAEKAGYRPCLRCRPECAPGSPAWSGKNTTIEVALKLISQNAHDDLNEDAFARKLGMGARHLRRLFKEELGKTPKQVYDNNRLNFARTLISETSLPITEIAFASGFSSIRRFNDAMKNRFHRAPRELRRTMPPSLSAGGIRLALPYRPPLDWPHLLQYYKRHQLIGIERIDGLTYERVFKMGNRLGAFRVSPHESKPQLLLEIHSRDTKHLFKIVQAVRRMFDLDSDPVLIANAFASSKQLSPLIRRYPGLRLPRGWDAFEAGVCAILGQLVSVDLASQLIAELIRHYGTVIKHPITGEAAMLFPTADVLAKVNLSKVGTTQARKRSIREFAQRVVNGSLSLASTQSPEEFRKNLLTIPGVGPWTAEVICLRSLGDTNAFPGTDLVLKRAMQSMPELELQSVTPWRGYAAIYLWRQYAALTPVSES